MNVADTIWRGLSGGSGPFMLVVTSLVLLSSYLNKRSRVAPNIGATVELEELLECARAEAASYNTPIGIEHLLLAMLRANSNYTTPIFATLAIDSNALRAQVRKLVRVGDIEIDPTENIFTRKAHMALLYALREAEARGDEYATPEHLLTVLSKGRSPIASALRKAGVTADRVRLATDNANRLPSHP